MSLEKIYHQKNWDTLVLKKNLSFMQSWAWGEFRQKNNIKVFRFKTQKSIFQLEKRRLGLGLSYFYVAGAPIFSSDIDLLQRLSRQEKAVFLKIEPLAKKLTPFSGLKPSFSIQPKQTLILNLCPDEEKLFNNFHPKHRYNIRLAQKREVAVRPITTNQEFESFYGLIQKTNQRKQIKSFPRSYYHALFRLAKTKDGLEVNFLGAYLGKILIAGLISVAFGKTTTYLVGASDYTYRKYMAPHLLQWEAIKLAKTKHCQSYDFWGIIKRDKFETDREFEHHPWAGITRFKEGFGGVPMSFFPAYDYVFRPTEYSAYRLVKYLK